MACSWWKIPEQSIIHQLEKKHRAEERDQKRVGPKSTQILVDGRHVWSEKAADNGPVVHGAAANARLDILPAPRRARVYGLVLGAEFEHLAVGCLDHVSWMPGVRRFRWILPDTSWDWHVTYIG